MINVVISGCNGSMGRALTNIIDEMDDMKIVAGIVDAKNTDENTLGLMMAGGDDNE